MKKVGIMTFHCADNFGAVLQVYALQQTIKELNIDVEIIDFRPQALIIPYNHTVNLKNRYSVNGIKGVIRALLSSIYNYRNIESRLKSFRKFRDDNLNISKEKYYFSQELLNSPPKYDYFLTGSDQVWNPSFKRKIGDSYFLDFVDNNAIKISYAASIAEEVDEGLIGDYKNHINRFDYISVREKSGVEFLQNIINNSVEVTLDPTLLLNKRKWKNISKKPNLKEKYILVYGLEHNNELIKLANRLSEEINIKIISYTNQKIFNNVIESFYFKGPDEFLGLFENAEVILTNSFHGTVFSVINNKPFYTIPHTTTGSRMIDLLKILNLEERIIYKAEDLKEFDFNIDYNEVDRILETKRQESINFLKKSFGIKDNR